MGMDCWIGVIARRSDPDVPQCVFLSEDAARDWVAQDPTPEYAYWEWRDLVRVPLITECAGSRRSMSQALAELRAVLGDSIDTAALERLRGDE